jgi:hypothetical protein
MDIVFRKGSAPLVLPAVELLAERFLSLLLSFLLNNTSPAMHAGDVLF